MAMIVTFAALTGEMDESLEESVEIFVLLMDLIEQKSEYETVINRVTLLN